MTRAQFNADVAAAAKQDIPGLSNIVKGDEDGEVDFQFTPLGQQPIKMKALAFDVSEYPLGNSFLLCTESEEPWLVGVFEHCNNLLNGCRVSELLLQTATELKKAFEYGSHDNPIDLDDTSESEDWEGGCDDDSLVDISDDCVRSGQRASQFGFNPESAAKLNGRIRQDIRAVRDAGFYAGILHGMKADSDSCLVSISIRVNRLGISDEALQAWDLQKQQYIILLVRYVAGYKTYDAVISDPVQSHEIEFRVGTGASRKPTVKQAMAAFASSRNAFNGTTNCLEDKSTGDKSGFQTFFISSSLNEFMNTQFISLLKIRHGTGTGWDDAKSLLKDNQGLAGTNVELTSKTFTELTSDSQTDSSSLQQGLSAIVTSDHIQEASSGQLSFPLITMQFFMRYLTRCTEFCLVCHDKIENKFEALKPYVCSKPLCLYQYMTLGFGPSIEHEIMTQPYVVDLLISFCYASAKSYRLREYPSGMSLLVPPVASTPSPVDVRMGTVAISPQPEQSLIQASADQPRRVKYDLLRHEIVFDRESKLNLKPRNWVVLTGKSGGDIFEIHYRVLSVMDLTVRLSTPGVQRSGPFINIQDLSTTLPIRDDHNDTTTRETNSMGQVSTTSLRHLSTGMMEVNLTVYEKNFDDLYDSAKADTIAMLLETIPKVKEMRAFLKRQSVHSEPSLAEWNDRISPSGLGLLRWIIASNRSCIVQVDKFGLQDETDNDMTIDSLRLNERVSGVDGWYQFRFAQGAPDKELRFQQALLNTKGIHNAKYPTIFAWHGSSIGNWHSIIRAGLDYKEVKNGRAFGHGCYFSQDHATSFGYCMGYGINTTWPGSELKISNAMCLNEIVNAPAQYISSFPHLVVQHVNWIQTRYLFVKTGNTAYQDIYNQKSVPASIEVPKPNVEIEQDPLYTVKGPMRQPIGIPRSAFPSSRELPYKTTTSLQPFDRLSGIADIEDYNPNEEEIISDDDDIDDLTFLLSDDESLERTIKGKSRKADDDTGILDCSPPHKRAKSMTGFVPGTLDRSSIQLMQPPEYATSSATRQLQRELKVILSVQEKTPLHELGWYIDKKLMENVYQWIVELHSFDEELPLSKDMKNAGLTSVVLEIRFGKDYPISPPFVRVIRPRFLPFSSHGGGHVTYGGAMCMELLTNTGWSAVSSLESVLLQVRLAISSEDPYPARLESQGKQLQRDYNIVEAIDAFIRACRVHGWEVPKDFKELA